MDMTSASLAEDLEEMNDSEFLLYFTDLEHKLKTLELENYVCVTYMNKLDPVYCQRALDNLDVTRVRGDSSVTSRISEIGSSRSQASFVSEYSIRSRGTLPQFYKVEILINIMEGSQEYYKKYLKRCKKLIADYSAEYDEAQITRSELKFFFDYFQSSVVEKGYDPLTKRIPAEKLLRYMDEVSRSAQLTIQKFLLHNNNEKILLNKLNDTLIHKRELGGNVHGVDFDQLIIQNRNLAQKIENTFKYLKELKKINGQTNLELTKYKNSLQKQQKDTILLKEIIALEKQHIEDLNQQGREITAQVEEEKDRYKKFKNFKDQFEVPSTLEYIQIKSKLYAAYRQLKILERRKQILDITLNASTMQMKNLLKTREIDPKWYKAESFISLHIQ